MTHTAKIDAFIKASKLGCIAVDKLLKQTRLEEDYTYSNIGEGGDHSLLIDIKAEKIFFNHFEGIASVYSEEFGQHGESDYNIVLDPIDGSDNFVSNFPYFGSSISLQYKDKTIDIVVCNFANEDFFFKKKVDKAKKSSLYFEKERLLSPNKHAKVGLFEKSSLNTQIIESLMKNKLKFRSPGAVALSLVYSFDASYMIFLGRMRSFDIEAGLFIASDLYTYKSDNTIILSSDKLILEKIKDIILGDI